MEHDRPPRSVLWCVWQPRRSVVSRSRSNGFCGPTASRRTGCRIPATSPISAQPADRDHARQRQGSRAEVGVAEPLAREVRSDALVVDGVLYTLQGPPVQGGYQVVALDAVDRATVLVARLPAGRRGASMLWPRQPWPRHSRRHAVHGHDRRPPDRDRCQDRNDTLERRSRSARSEEQREVLHHACADGRQGQDRHGYGWRRLRRSRVHCRLRCQERQGALALRYHSASR